MIALKCLDICCGGGGASVGLVRAGFEVTGVDIVCQKHYPYPFIQADGLTLPPEFIRRFDLVWASCPCQRWSMAGGTAVQARHLDLLTPMRALLQEAGVPYILENVPQAPLRDPILLCGTQFGLKVFRHRLFESNYLLLAPPHAKHSGATGSHRWPYTPTGGYVQVTGNGGNFTLASGRAAMGIDWMQTKHELAQAIPPAYSEYLGAQLYRALQERAA